MRRRRRDDYLDSRITQRAVDLFSLAKTMMAEGYTFSHDSSPPTKLRRVSSNVPHSLLDELEHKTLIEVGVQLHRELRLKPWMPNVLDFEVYTMVATKYPPHAEFHVIADLHRRLTEAA